MLFRSITEALPSGLTNMDQHFAWNVLNDTWPILSSSFPSSGSILTPAHPWVGEILGWQPIHGPNPYRFAATYCTSANPDFSTAQCIGAGSQTGNFFMWTTDMLDTLGSTTGAATCTPGSTCRGDVVFVALK